ncbi:hypothetical protein ACJX0J_020849 [Zea mays]
MNTAADRRVLHSHHYYYMDNKEITPENTASLQQITEYSHMEKEDNGRRVKRYIYKVVNEQIGSTLSRIDSAPVSDGIDMLMLILALIWTNERNNNSESIYAQIFLV